MGIADQLESIGLARTCRAQQFVLYFMRGYWRAPDLRTDPFHKLFLNKALRNG